MLSKEKKQNTLIHFANPHSTYTAFKRVVHTLMFSISIGLLIAFFLLFQRYQAQWLDVQTSQPGKALTAQYASLIAAPLQSKNTDVLLSMVTKFTSDPLITSVTIYDEKGVHLAPLAQHDSVVSLLQNTSLPPTIYLENVLSTDGSVVGYLRVVLDSEALLVKPLEIRAQQEQLVVVLAMLCFILGVYATRTFYKARVFLVGLDKPSR